MFSFEGKLFNKLLKKEDATVTTEIEKSVSTKFRTGTMEDMAMPEGGRGLEVYEKELMFDRSELKGKAILDLGAGPEIKLTKDLKDVGVDAQVVSLSPDYAEQKFASGAKVATTDSTLVAGVGQELPFKNESFDNIFALHIGEHLTGRQFLEVVSEMARTLKVNGKAIIGPITDEKWDFNEHWKPYEAIMENLELKQKLDELSVKVEKAMIPEEIIKPRRLRDSHGMKYYEPAFNIVLRKISKIE